VAGSPPDPEREVTRTGYGQAEEAGDDEGGLDALHPTGSAGARCELCGGRVEERHCKIVCLNCGYQRDCSDP
jgi:hypothetical protein